MENVVIPQMTSDNTPPPFVATASSYSKDVYKAFGLFDSVEGLGGRWESATTDSNPWVKIDVGSIKKMNEYAIIPWGGAFDPKVFRLEGSNDDVNWDIIDSQTIAKGSDWRYNVKKKFPLGVTKAYRYYRLNIQENFGNPYTTIGELDIYHT